MRTGKEDGSLGKLQVGEVASSGDSRARLQRILDHAAQLPRLPGAKVATNRVMGPTVKVSEVSPSSEAGTSIV